VAREAFKLRAELVERSFALVLDRGGMRRAWLRGRENLHKRYLVHVAGYNLGLIMRLLVGAGTPREFLAGGSAHLLLLTTADGVTAAILVVATETEAMMVVVSFQPEPHDEAGFLQRAANGRVVVFTSRHAQRERPTPTRAHTLCARPGSGSDVGGPAEADFRRG
jgi:hypothetical protein